MKIKFACTETHSTYSVFNATHPENEAINLQLVISHPSPYVDDKGETIKTINYSIGQELEIEIKKLK